MSWLGKATQIAVGVKDVQRSFSFYEKLGFRMIAGAKVPNPWMQITDGSLLILLNEDGKPYIGLNYFSDAIAEKISLLEQKGIYFSRKVEHQGTVVEAVIHSPDDVGVVLINFDPGDMYQPHDPTMLNFPKKDLRNPVKFRNPKCGLFGELCHSVEDLRTSVAFWEALGYETKSITQSPYPRAICSDGSHIVGLHQHDAFSQPALTYFAPDQSERVKSLKKAGISSIEPFEDSVGEIKNYVITTPDGRKIFLFSL